MSRCYIRLILYSTGVFYAASVADESVLGVTSDEDNTQLITGDTKGHVSVWDIQDHCIVPSEKVIHEILTYRMNCNSQYKTLMINRLPVVVTSTG